MTDQPTEREEAWLLFTQTERASYGCKPTFDWAWKAGQAAVAAQARTEAVEEARQHLRDAFAAGRASERGTIDFREGTKWHDLLLEAVAQARVEERAAIVAYITAVADDWASLGATDAAHATVSKALAAMADRLAEREP